MRSTLITIYSAFSLIAAVTAVDYCSQKLCLGNKHIGCQNDGRFKKACPVNKTTLINMTSALKEKIVDSHNTKRSSIASGKMAKFKPAVRMSTMMWNDELAQLAECNARTCQFEHDECHNTEDFWYSGQNLGRFRYMGRSYTDEEIVLSLIDSWWAEYKDADMLHLEKYRDPSNKTIGHFTVMVAAKNAAVGCSGVRFPLNDWTVVQVTCDYAATNFEGRPLYVPGPTGSQCLMGVNPKYPGLCSLKERFDYKKIL